MLDLAQLADKAARVAFNVAGTAIQSITYNRRGAVTYNPAVGVTEAVTTIATRALMEMVVASPNERRPMVSQADFTGEVRATVIASELGFVPVKNDSVTWASVTRIIREVEQADPTGALYYLILKEPT